MTAPRHTLDIEPYTISTLRDLVERRAEIAFSTALERQVDEGAQFVARLSRTDAHVYGVNTGFGSLCEVRVAPEQMRALQARHVLSHAAGVGEPVSESVSRLVVLAKLLTLRSGRTGIRMPTLRRLADLLNAGAAPVIPEKGTVGASGDLAPLAHMSLPLLGLGEVWVNGKREPAGEFIAAQGWEPLDLEVKEGLALTNGIQFIAARGAESVWRLSDLALAAEAVAALSCEAFSVARTCFHPLYHETTGHMERRAVARRIRGAIAGGNHADLPTANRSKQDPYSFRCIPQIHGAAWRMIDFARDTIEIELNGVSDNPLFFAEHELALYGGNLHGQATAYVLDLMAMAAADLASVSERRTYQLLSGQRGLPDFLVPKPGVNSGLMLLQYTAASLVNECKVLCTPSSVDTIPTCQLQEDHVSMGGTGANKLQTVLTNLEYVLAIEWIAAAQASELTPELTLSEHGRDMVSTLREAVDRLETDRVMAGDIEVARAALLRTCRDWASRLNEGAADDY